MVEPRAELLDSLALRVFRRDELLQIIESAACQPAKVACRGWSAIY
jgi:hypothetical protein